MGNPIVKLGGLYVVWSTIVDAPITFGMTRPELEQYIRGEYGAQGIADLGPRLARVDEKGTSSVNCASALDTVWLNRAGAGETCMSIAQLVDYYCVKRDPAAPLPRGENNPPQYPEEH